MASGVMARLTTDSTKVMAAAKASRVFALRCATGKAIRRIPGDRGQQQDADILASGGERGDAGT